MFNYKKKEKIKLVIGINDLMVGGAQRLVCNQLHYFNKNYFDIYLVVLKKFETKNLISSDSLNDINLIQLNFKSVYSLRCWFNLYSVIKKIRPDTVVSHLFFSNLVFRILKLFLGYKIITVEHNTYKYKKKYEIRLDKILSYLSFKIIAVSQTVASFASTQTGIKISKFEVIHNGIILDEITNYKKSHQVDDIRKKLNISPEEKIILSVGRLAKQKNQDLLIRSFAFFAENNDNYKLFILGEGDLKEDLINLVKKLKVTDKVFLLGSKSNVFDYYFVAEFLVSTSFFEGLSLTYLEALAFELPLVVTKTAGTDELVVDNKNGFFIELNKESAVAGMNKVLNSNFQELKIGALASAKHFDIRENVRKYSHLIKLAQ